MEKGRFIVLEGGEGTGKTVQTKLLLDYLAGCGIESIITREPGGCPVAEKIREVIVRGKAEDLNPVSEFLLLSASRTEHVRQKIVPTLSQGKWVISDRYYFSSYAHQAHTGKVDFDFVKSVTKLAIDGNEPELTFILDLPADIGIERSLSKLSTAAEKRFEGKSLSYHESVREGYLNMARDNDNIVLINADQEIDRIHHDIVEELKVRGLV
ncbi:MAG: dTMP kinase [Proteobacteria bacterium]|nr:dTMP kinase [Pseudomonadota bacterium]